MNPTEQLNSSDIETLKILAFFYFKVNLFDSCSRTVKVMLKYDNKNVWAKGMLVRCSDKLSDYKQVVTQTEDMSFFDSDKNIQRSVLLLRARALLKLGREAESKQLVKFLTDSGRKAM
jgi:transcription elongation factor GreA-like protein